MFAMFYAHAHMRYMKNGEHPSRITLTTFTRSAQNSTVVSVLALYGSTMLHCRYKKAMSGALLCEDIRTFFPA